jgi:hypothetical protein
MNSAHLYRSIQIIRVRLRYEEIKKSKTVNFYCIVDYAHWDTTSKKKRTLLLYLCGGVEKNKKYKNKRNSRFLHAVTTKLLICQKNMKNKKCRELHALHFL